MLHYYLHLFNGIGAVPDEEGVEVESFADAYRLAIESIRSLISADVKHGRIDLRGRIEIAGTDQARVRVVPFAEAVRLTLEDER